MVIRQLFRAVANLGFYNKTVFAFQGSHTLPRAGNRRPASEKSSQDDTNVVVSATNRRGVRIRICGDEILTNSSFLSSNNTFSNIEEEEDQHQALTFNNNNVVNKNKNKNLDLKKPSKVILENLKEPKNLNHFVETKELNVSPAFVVTPNGHKKAKTKRKYTLEELEVEGFEPSTSESERHSNIQEELDDDVSPDEDEVDLSSLIEGGVDDDDVDADVDVEKSSSMVFPEMETSSTSSRRPSRPQLTIVDDVDDDDDEEIFGEDQELVSFFLIICPG